MMMQKFLAGRLRTPVECLKNLLRISLKYNETLNEKSNLYLKVCVNANYLKWF